jgi:hypothetical protein
MPQIFNIGQDFFLLPLRGKAGLNPRTWGSKSQHATSRPPKPLMTVYYNHSKFSSFNIFLCFEVKVETGRKYSFGMCHIIGKTLAVQDGQMPRQYIFRHEIAFFLDYRLE